MFSGRRISFLSGPARKRCAIVSNSARSASASWKGWPGRSIDETPPSGMRKRTGPVIAFSLSARKTPIARHSSAVVRISVTVGLWR